jgi:hypothetical protein
VDRTEGAAVNQVVTVQEGAGVTSRIALGRR